MAKKGGLLKTIAVLGAVGVASKVVYDKYKSVKEKFEKEELDCAGDEIKVYNAVCSKRIIEIEDEEFTGCDVTAVCSSVVVDLGLADFTKDVYVNFDSKFSSLTIIVPEGINVACDVDKKLSGVNNLVDNEEEDAVTVYVIGDAICSNIEVIPVDFYIDDDDDFEDIDDDIFVDESETSAVAEAVDEAAETVEEVAEAVEEAVEDVVELLEDEDLEELKKLDGAEEIEVEEV